MRATHSTNDVFFNKLITTHRKSGEISIRCTYDRNIGHILQAYMYLIKKLK